MPNICYTSPVYQEIDHPCLCDFPLQRSCIHHGLVYLCGHLKMSLRFHLDRYCHSRSSDPIAAMQTTPPRSHSPTRNHDGTITPSVRILCTTRLEAPTTTSHAPCALRDQHRASATPLHLEDGFDIFSSATTAHLMSMNFTATTMHLASKFGTSMI